MTKATPRSLVTAAGMEKTITMAVQQNSPDCNSFIGVYIEHTNDHSSGANWTLKGVKYGHAPRGPCDAALESIVSSLQDRYLIETLRATAGPIPASPDPRPLLRKVSPLAAAFDRVANRSAKS